MDRLPQPATTLPNGFDNLAVDVSATYQAFPLGRRSDSASLWKSRLQRLYANPLLPLGLRRRMWVLLHRARLDQEWFTRFRIYWAEVLRGRPLWGIEDFYFLRNLYRMRFQAVHLAETNDPVTHLEAWQRPELLHHLFHSVYKESLFHRLDVAIRLERSRPRIRSVLEFGCGTAPVATTFFEFFRAARDLRLFLADIETIPFHYAAWKFAEFPNVHAVALRASNHFRLELDEPLDAIVCLGVLEHLDDPLGTTSRLHALLRRGGLLIFDYVLTTGGGLDTAQGARDRPRVLQFIETNFRLLDGPLAADASVALTVARRA